ncbi:MAG: ABC transporter permease [Pirellulaceae bacterium]|jgi:putative ABC transport system permease protein|nr:ABC transporter permease [Pirellulaceae bacterium]
MRFSSLIWKNLVRRPMRSALTLLALATAIAAVVSLQGISRGFTRSFGEIYTAHSVDIVVSRAGSADRLSSSIDQRFSEEIAKLPEVNRTAAVLLDTLSLEDEGVYGIPAMGIARDSWIRRDYEIQRARKTEVNPNDLHSDQNDTPPDENGSAQVADTQAAADRTVWLGIHLADRLGVSPGGTVNLFDEPYRVAALFKSRSTWENGAMIFDLDELQRLTDRRGQATYINVVLNPPVAGEARGPSRAQRAVAAIKQLDNKLLPLATQEFVDTDTRLKLAGAMAWMTSMIAMTLGVIGTLNTMLTSVMERTKEIGILRAIGWPKRRVVSMILLESCSLALLASLLGTGMAMLLTWGLAQAPMVKGVLSPAIDGGIVMQGFVLAIAIGLLGALLPAWRAAKLLPTEAFRET